MPALDVSGLSYAYGQRRALDQVGFQVMPSSFTALLGPNGAGKSTLFALITGLFDSPPGTIRVFGRDLRQGAGPALARMGVVFQQSTLDLDMSVDQNLIYFAALHGISRRRAMPPITALLDRLDLTARRHDKVRDLNGGHRRRVEIARALVHGPDLLLLDEPTQGLDPPARRQLVDLIHAMCAETGLAVLWATHLVDEIRPETDRLVVLEQGQVRAHGHVGAVLAMRKAASLGDLFGARGTA